jgi:hypothetical protein
MPANKLAGRLVTVFGRYRDRWDTRNWRRWLDTFGSSQIHSTARKAARSRRKRNSSKVFVPHMATTVVSDVGCRRGYGTGLDQE